MTELVQILAAIQLFCGPPHISVGKNFHADAVAACRGTAWKCVDKVRKKKEKRQCRKYDGDLSGPMRADFVPAIVCETLDEDKEMEKCFR